MNFEFVMTILMEDVYTGGYWKEMSDSEKCCFLHHHQLKLDH